MSDLPNWVYDVVIELVRWSDEHPKLFAQYNGTREFQTVDDCGCEALEHVPAEVRERAQAIKAYMNVAERARMGVPADLVPDMTATDIKAYLTPPGPWLHTCNLGDTGLNAQGRHRCRACEAEAARAGDP